MKKYLCILIAVIMVLSVSACGSTTPTASSDNSTSASAPAASSVAPSAANSAASGVVSPLAGKKIAYILNLSTSDIFQMYADRVKQIAGKLGMTADVYFSDTNDNKWQDDINTCAAAGYDGLILSHGGQNYSYTFISGILKQYPKLKIVTFDTQFVDSKGSIQKIPGVTQYFQEDAGLARVLLDELLNLNPDKKNANKPINIIKCWMGPNFCSPFDRRQVGYEEYEDKGLIKTLETIGPTNFANAEPSMEDVMTATLAKYKPGDIDGIWVAYDAFGRGAYRAIMNSNKKIPMVSVDICNTDIDYMKAKDSVWKACACTDFAMNGEIAVRILALEMNDEYDKIYDPATKKMGADWVEVPASCITQDMLKPDTTLQNLTTVAPATYGSKDYLSKSDWMTKLIGY